MLDAPFKCWNTKIIFGRQKRARGQIWLLWKVRISPQQVIWTHSGSQTKCEISDAVYTAHLEAEPLSSGKGWIFFPASIHTMPWGVPIACLHTNTQSCCISLKSIGSVCCGGFRFDARISFFLRSSVKWFIGVSSKEKMSACKPLEYNHLLFRLKQTSQIW